MSKRQYIRAGWLIDGSGGPIKRNVLLEIIDGILTTVDDSPPQNLPPGSKLTNLSHCTILPPLIDSHAHLFMSGTTDKKTREEQLKDGYETLRPRIAQHLHYLFSHGIVAVRDGGDRGAYALRYRSEKNDHPGMTIKSAGRAWHREGRYGSLIGRSVKESASLADAYEKDTDPGDHVKLVNSGLNSLHTFGHETAPQFDTEEIAALVGRAEQHGKKVMVHANGRLPVQFAVKGGCQSIEHGFFMGQENLELMAEKGTIWVPTLFTMKAYAENIDHAQNADIKVIKKTLDHQLKQLTAARSLGVTVALGTDAGSLGVLHGESMVEEMKLFMKAGYSLSETVRCVCYNGARLLGLKDIGLLQKGKAASFIVTRGAPAQLPRKLSYLEAMYVDGAPSSMYLKNPVKHV